MSKRLIAIRQEEPVMQITWVINNICTNACSYCPAGLHNGTNHHYDWENAKRFCNMLLDKYPKINLSIAGGEPTVSPYLPDLLEMFYSRGHGISLTTNGARSVRYYEKISKNINSISFSFHPSFEDPKFLEKALAANEYTRVSVRVMMDTRYWDRCIDFYNKALTHPGISVEAVRIQDWSVPTTEGRDYTEEQLRWFEGRPTRYPSRDYELSVTNQHRLSVKGLKMRSLFYKDDGTVESISPILIINEKLNDFCGWVCNIGLESLFIHYDGDIQRGNCRQGTPTRIIGNINRPEEIQWPVDPEICLQRECHCSTDVLITKWNPNVPQTQFNADINSQ